MTTGTINFTPEPAVASDRPAHHVAVHVGVPAQWLGGAEAVAFPPGNWTGTAILERALSHALRGAGLLAGDGSAAGDLFRNAFLLFPVTTPLPALRVVIAELKATKLSGLAEVGWFDPAEEIWRTAWPVPAPPAPFDRWLSDEAILARHLEFLEWLLRSKAAGDHK
jgi:hypothetical protein